MTAHLLLARPRPSTSSTGRASRAKRFAALALLSLVLVALGACSATDKTSSANVAAPKGSPATTSAGQVAADASGGSSANANFNVVVGDQTPVATNQPDPNAGRSVISTATLEVKVEDVAAAKGAAATSAEKAGGFVFGEQTSFGASAKAVLTLKVPPASFRKVLDELGGLGSLSSEDIKTDDVTQQVVDLDARISAASDSLDRTRALLGQAKTMPDISTMENEVVRRQTDLETLRGQQKTLMDKVSLSTVVVTLSGDADATAAVQKQREDEQRKKDEDERKKNEAKPLPGFFDGFNGGLGVAQSVGTVALAVLGAVIPFLPVLLLAYVAVRLLRRGTRTKPAASSSSS